MRLRRKRVYDVYLIMLYPLKECSNLRFRKFPLLDALFKSDPPVVTAKLYELAYVQEAYVDVRQAEETLIFLESGRVKHVYKEWKDYRLIKRKKQSYDRTTSERINSTFNQIDFDTWVAHSQNAKTFTDHGCWSLNISFSNGEILNCGGEGDYPPDWDMARGLFGIYI